MPKTLFFDLGNVLLFFDHGKMVSQIANYCQIPHHVVQEAMVLYGEPYERGTIDSWNIFCDLKTLTNKTLHFETLMEAVGNIFEPNYNVIAMALEAQAHGHPLFVLSNTCEAHFQYALTHYPFLKQCNGHVLSFQLGTRKPEEKIYQKALEIAGCRAEDCFYIDDIPEYVQTARRLKIDAELYTSPQALKGHFVTRGIPQLP